MTENIKNEITVMQFEGNDVDIIMENGEPLFEVYSTGMALGQIKIAKGIAYPRKERIDENLKNAEIIAVVRNGQRYITESQLYDLMLEMKTDKARKFRKWITEEVVPSIVRTGGYVTEGYEHNFLSTLLQRIEEQDRFQVEQNKMLQEAITVLQKQVIAQGKLLNVKPDMYKINTWKKHTGTPVVEKLASALGMDKVEKSLYGDIYEEMNATCGFNRVTAVMDYRAKYHLDDSEDVTPINAIADDPVYQRDFVITVNRMIAKVKSVHTDVAPVVTPLDKFDAAIRPLIELRNDKSAHGMKTLALVYDRMRSKQSWAVMKGKNKCNTKKELIMKKDGEYDLFCKTVDKMIKEISND